MKYINKLFFPKDHKEDHFKALDGLRGIAVLVVLFSHSSQSKLFFWHHLNFRGTGKLGVYLFFILSAYLLDRQIALAIKNKKTNFRYWLNYIFRRFIRIYPLFVLALVGNYLLYTNGFRYSIPITDTKDLTDHLLLQKGKSIFWSIPVEFIYYFISPVILIIIGYLTKWRIKLIFPFILFLIAFVTILNPNLDLTNISTLKFLPIFLVGTLISLVEVFSDTFKENDKKDAKLYDILGIASAIIIVLTFREVFIALFGIKYKPYTSYAYFIQYSILWTMILIASKYGYIVKKILSFKPLRFIGVISFSMYLFHIPILKLVRNEAFFHPSIKIYAFIACSIIFSTITYLLVERPLSKVRIKF